MARDPDHARVDDETDRLAQTIVTFTDPDDGRQTTLEIGNLGAKDSRLVRMATGAPLQFFVGQVMTEVEDHSGMDLDTVGVLWWLARRRAGEMSATKKGRKGAKKLTYLEVEDSLTYTHMPDVEIDDGDDDDNDDVIDVDEVDETPLGGSPTQLEPAPPSGSEPPSGG